MSAKKTLICALYARVSTEMQVDRESLKTQKSKLKAYWKANQESNYKLYEDPGYSAKDTERPGLKRLLQDIKKGEINKIVITNLDRLSRSLKDLLELLPFLEQHKVDLVSLTQQIDSRMSMCECQSRCGRQRGNLTHSQGVL